MYRQCHFGKVKSSSCSSTNTAVAVTLRYSGQKALANNDTWAKTMAVTCLLHHDCQSINHVY